MQDETPEKKSAMVQKNDFLESGTTDDEDSTKTIKDNVRTEQN